MLLDRPYFMTNKEWFYHDEKEEKYKLTDKAPKKAIESYTEFYKILEDDTNVGHKKIKSHNSSSKN